MPQSPPNRHPGIVIPFYFGGDYIEETLGALERQTFGRWSAVIVVDGATAEESRQLDSLAGEEDRLSITRTAGSMGPAHARNVGARTVSSECDVVLFLDCDDVLKPDALATLCALIDESSDAPAAHGVCEYLGGEPAPHRPADITSWGRNRFSVGSGWALEPVPLTAPTDFATLAVSNWIATPGQVLIRRGAFERVGGFSESVPRAVEDWDLWLRLAAMDPLAFTDTVVLEWRQHDASLSNDGSIMQTKEEQYRRSLASSDLLTEEQRRQVVDARRAEWRRRRNSKLSHAREAMREWRIADAGREIARAGKATAQIWRPCWTKQGG